MPYRSEAQRRYFHAHREQLAEQGVVVDHWDRVSEGLKLPERADKRKKKSGLRLAKYVDKQAENLDLLDNPYEHRTTKKLKIKKASEFSPDYTPEQLREMGVYKQVYGPKNASRLASLKEWPAHWYNKADPHGWLQWYDRYSKGRRIEDDKRQIKRWIAFKSRHGGPAFQNNPTPRRAFALRNWAIDPENLVKNPQALRSAMEEYQTKKLKTS
jgi:hypothetical protein